VASWSREGAAQRLREAGRGIVRVGYGIKAKVGGHADRVIFFVQGVCGAGKIAVHG
jgi:hypothetical protein